MLFRKKIFILSKTKENIVSLIFTIILALTFIVTNPEYSIEIPSYIETFSEIILICILILNCNNSVNNINIASGKKYLYAYLVALVSPIVILRLIPIQSFGMKIIVEITILCSLFIILRLFKIKVTNFNFRLNSKTFTFSILLGLGCMLINIICKTISGTSIKNTSFIYIFFKFINCFIYVGFFEEFTGRGLLMSGLKSYNLPNYLINIIQSIIFGVLHYGQYGSFGIYSILSTSSQMIFGYLMGLIYLRTKSLMPAIIIHALFDFGIFIYT